MTKNKDMVFAGICAGGQGTRLNSDIPKQFLLLKGKPVITYSVERFLQYQEIERVFVAVSENYIEFCRGLFTDERVRVIKGGRTRSETVAVLVKECEKYNGGGDDILVTHDAARPFVSVGVINSCIEAAREYGVSGAAVGAVDTVLQCEDGFVCAAPPRAEMFLAQTPQCFQIGIFNKVWDSLSDLDKEKATDVCGMFFRAGVKVRIVEGDKDCFKITVKDDFERAENIAEKL